MSVICTSRTLDRMPSVARAKEYFVFQHVRDDTAGALLEFARRGYRIAQVVGIEYSTQQTALNMLRTGGIPVEITTSEKAPDELRRYLTAHPFSQREVVVLDVGGYAAEIAEDASHSPALAGVVEETNNGLWRYENTSTLIPVVQIAKCANKSIENALVGRAIVEATTRALVEPRFDLRASKVGVLGFGGIGEHVAMALRNYGVARIAVFDPDPQRMMLSIARGFLGPGRVQLLNDSEIIIGCAGRESISVADLPLLIGPKLLVSGSSKQVEFLSLCRENSFETVEFGPLTALSNGEIIVINSGKPINLAFSSLPASFGDFLFANLFAAVAQLLSDAGYPGIRELSVARQKQVATDWLALYR